MSVTDEELIGIGLAILALIVFRFFADRTLQRRIDEQFKTDDSKPTA